MILERRIADRLHVITARNRERHRTRYQGRELNCITADDVVLTDRHENWRPDASHIVRRNRIA